ncbi:MULTISPECIES: AEC family transporter [Brenneria]|uniref:AEC family transporter n=1 Tax=Brenneria nigrifluens DSM 30175 = ATCC 13028 TaxID=1121120 RepID=A0A2U1UF91_9GAMM|nr:MULTISPECIES: AEC family transporter [Brenneria]EHD22184.1 Auxin Efflux Carrier [Brenneria sp. EniD312]PWC20331.1 AEC family transporter [Brenneria nigrifluens] [Brenneria nigrifluens DSM 30175 = ATCC 13028]QCR05212.1 AEC family transporter [Brenneria nigrifluens] [Brenneria nigrifluens DSM 30175 = ATCC 13028]
MTVSQTILPVFLLIILGYILALRGTLDPHANKVLGGLAFKLFMPMVLFTGMVNAPLHDGLNIRILAAYFVPALFIFAVVNLFAHRSVGHPTPFGLTASFSNNALIGLAMVGGLYGNAGLVLLFTVLAVHSLLLFSFQSLYSCLAGSVPFKPGVLVASLANPMIVGLLLGTAVNLSGLILPDWNMKLATWLAQAALPCALIVLGANLSGYRLRPDAHVVGITVAKLAAMPLLVLLVCILLGISGMPRGVLVLMAANPSGVNVLGFSRSQQDSQIISSAICLTTLLSIATIPLWIWINSLL